jgi:hypothetical protein
MDQTLKWKLVDQQVAQLLVIANLLEIDGTTAVYGDAS